ncbi:MAG: DRTGG domain-containing protein [Bacteroidales bacterium]|nr:DRTGG domain-containing protein [Bacteroidales bacterium]
MEQITVENLAEKLNLECLGGKAGLHHTVKGVYISDLLSDVVGHARESDVWVTLHTHVNIVAVATLKNLSAIIITGGRVPDKETIAACDAQQIPVLVTQHSTFHLAGQLYRLLASNEEF